MQAQNNEKKRKKRAMFIALFFNAALVGLALLPFMTSSFTEPEEPEALMVMVDLTDFASSSSSSSQKSDTQKEKTQTKKAPAPQKPKPTPPPKPIETVDKVEDPVPTTPEPPKRPSRIEPTPTKAEPQPNTTPTDEPSTDEVAEKDAKDTSGGAKSSDGKGNGDDAKADKGKGKGVEDFSGDGIFNRKVVYRGNVKAITEKTGTIVINLCINRKGRVIYAKPDYSGCTIRDSAILKRAINCALEYRFEKDYTVPEKQCGKLTFIFRV